jgi:peptide/nickel transport system permease protein
MTPVAIASDAAPAVRRPVRHVLAALLARPSGRIGLVLVVLHIVLAVVSPLLTPYDVATQSLEIFVPPSAQHWFGTDQLGRDVLSRTLVGGRLLLAATAQAAMLAIAWGGAAGMALGLAGGRMDELAMRLVDAFLAIPSLLFLLLVAFVFRGSTEIVVPTFGFFYGLPILRVARAATREVRDQDYVVAARVRGESRLHLVWTEIRPNVADTVIVEGTMEWSWMILAFSALSFLGLGVQPPTPDWGQMVADARGYLTIAPWAAAAPCLALVSLIVGLNFLSDAIGKALGIDAIRTGR